MKLFLQISLALTVCAVAAEPRWTQITAAPHLWEDSLPLLTARRSLLVLDQPMLTHVRGWVHPSPRKHGLAEPEIRAQVAGIFEALPAQEKVDLRIEWLTDGLKPVDFSRSACGDGMVRSSCRLGKTTFIRTVLVSEEEDAVFIHLLADQPGALSFRVTFGSSGEGNPEITDRRQFVRAATDKPAGIGSHVWVLPFESDVATEGTAIAVRGEGEALILITYAAGKDGEKPLSETLSRFGNRYDPGHNPPDPAKIWRGVLDHHLKSIENSP